MKTVTRGKTARRADRGFTLLELLVVILIAATLLKIAWPNMASLMEHYRLDGAARKLMANIQKARFRAIAERKCFQVVFGGSVPAGSYLVQTGPATQACNSATYTSDGVSQQIDSQNALTVTASASPIIFDTRGFATTSSPITITLQNRRGAQRLVTVTVTGRIRIT